MLWVGLSGGIGSGKSTVSARLADLGAVVVDADLVAREVVAPGRPALAEIVDRFGARVLQADGALDRAALGALVFSDPGARRDLEAITHPRIADRTRELLAAAPQDAVVVHDIPLLVELGRASDYALTVIVDVPAEERLRRLVELRGSDPGEARRRIAAQADDGQRRAAADVLLDNTGSVEELTAAVGQLWEKRLVPYEANLRSGTATPPPGTATPPPATAMPPPGAARGVEAADDALQAQADRLLDRLRAALGTGRARADHLGSTTVPGPPAQDVVDLQVVVDDLGVLDAPDVRHELTTRGFVVVDGPGSWERAPGSGEVGPGPERLIGTGDPGRSVHCRVRAQGRHDGLPGSG